MKRGKYYPASGSARSRDNGPLFKDRSNSSNGLNRPKDGPYANGDIDCRALNKRIDKAICALQSEKKPELCAGCPYKKEGI